jgi:IclR family pca regulon transcriptional regulator
MAPRGAPTHRYVITLTALGYLKQDRSRKYLLGLHVTDLGMSALNSTGLGEHSQPYLEELRQRTSYTANLAVLDGSEILYVARARSFRRAQNKIDLGLASGSRLPVHCTAMGKLLLANLPTTTQHELIDEMKLPKRGPNRITNKKSLRTALESVREEGLAVNDEELAPGLLSIAVPVRCESGEVRAALNMAAHTSMILVAGTGRAPRAASHHHGRPDLRTARLPPSRRAGGWRVTAQVQAGASDAHS